MKRTRIVAPILTALAILSLTTAAFAQDVEGIDGTKTITINADNGKNQIVFVSEAPAEKIKGTAKKITGEVKMNFDDLSKTTGKISFPVDTMETGNRMRDRHLKGDDWLNAKKNPNIVFTVTGLSDIKKTKDTGKVLKFSAVANGTVNVNGVDAPNKAKVTITIAKSAKKGAYPVKIEPILKVALADHKVEG